MTSTTTTKVTVNEMFPKKLTAHQTRRIQASRIFLKGIHADLREGRSFAPHSEQLWIDTSSAKLQQVEDMLFSIILESAGLKEIER